MRRKQEEIFEENYKRYSKILLKIIYSYIGNYDDCQDIMQEVFYRLLYKSPKFKSEEHKKNWLIRIAINLSKDYHKNFWQRMTEELSEDYIVQNHQENTSVRELVMQLPVKYRETIVLYYICGYSVNEIGTILKLGESAVKMRLQRARKMLKMEWEEQ